MISHFNAVTRGRLLVIGLTVGIIGFCAAWPLLAAGASANPPAPETENFGQYLADHQADLTPFFSAHSGEFVAKAMPLVLGWMGRMMFVSLLVGWGVDVLAGYAFATLFAPVRARWNQAFIYGTGRLVLSIVLTILLTVAVLLVASISHLVWVIFLTILFLVAVGALAQIAWICYRYRAGYGISIVFYLVLLAVHGLIGLVAAVPLAGVGESAEITDFVNRTVTPKLQDEADARKKELASITPARDAAAAEVAQLQAKIDGNDREQADLRKQIEDKKNSEAYLFSQIVKLHARGELQAAHDQFTSLLARFPDGPLTGLLEGQLTQVNSELAVDAAQKQHAKAAAARVAAQDRARLLLRAGKGEVTLSEMRLALIGKTRAEVSALFGAPSETASDRWGYAQPMILNPMTDQKHGLAIYFFEGTVQSVDYYYGAGGGSDPMNVRIFLVVMILPGVCPGFAGNVRADGSGLSATRLEMLDKRGCFPPAFKAAVHDLVSTRQALAQARADQDKFKLSLPSLKSRADDGDATVASLRKELVRYAQPEDVDYDALQHAMQDPATQPGDALALAQSFVWSYPTDPRQAEVEQDLQKIQKQLADQQASRQKDDAAKAVARAALVQRALAKELSFREWNNFLRDMSQEEVVTYLGPPQTRGVDSWNYTGDWAVDPITKKKAGLQVFFNGTRVVGVTELAK